MASKGKSYAEILDRWHMLEEGLKAHPDELGFLTADLGELTALIEKGNTLAIRLEGLRADLGEATREREDVIVQGEQLRIRVTSTLRGRYGLKNERLKEFGLRPLRARPPRKTPEAASREAAPAAALE
ncbi:MAG TPA: hypothetical protein VN783_08510 [Thermoanaerobaculia bacterium]|nr:hypothetical protein [Thermoanaerobaculia bacterium]